MDATTPLRLPPKLRARVHTIAKQTGRSAHSLIVEAIERHVEYEEQMRIPVKDALDTDDDIETSSEACRAEDVHAWLDRLKVGVRSLIALSGGAQTSRGPGGAFHESEQADSPT